MTSIVSVSDLGKVTLQLMDLAMIFFRCQQGWEGDFCDKAVDIINLSSSNEQAIIIAFSVIGGVFAIGLVVFLVVWCKRKNRDGEKRRFR